MIYTKLTRRAMLIAYNAHSGQYDKAGYPYICHPMHVAESMTDEDTCVAALLHDVVEDTHVTIEDLHAAGFTEKQIEAVDLLTHRSTESYDEYVRRIKDNRIAKAVKLADLEHNSDITRLDHANQNEIKRLQEKYEKAKAILNKWD